MRLFTNSPSYLRSAADHHTSQVVSMYPDLSCPRLALPPRSECPHLSELAKCTTPCLWQVVPWARPSYLQSMCAPVISSLAQKQTAGWYTSAAEPRRDSDIKLLVTCIVPSGHSTAFQSAGSGGAVALPASMRPSPAAFCSGRDL